ncbi:Early nodulin-like protein 1 [Sesamum alatum]|uniref:Early nodulin-like protein 1 n=1 Tax=Sesamum alatum TaxID=300844 RepID=A0AAE2CL09_9LAMI|nr:Early nodulin-like protein 1 [Sesamum alatum]
MTSSQSMHIPRTRFLLLLLSTIFCFHQLSHCTEFEVGDRAGWAVPPPNDTHIYNQWASHKRFKVADTIRFKYKKDSVMKVNKKDYNECNSTRPEFFSNTGNTIVTLDRSGFFYFISGATGHCDKGQRMIVWVMGQDGSARTSGASNTAVFLSYGLLVIIVAFHSVYLH